MGKPLTFPRLPRSLLYPRPITFDNFGGGLNMVDDPTQLSLSETPECFNVVFDSRGRMKKRYGWASVKSLTAGSMVFYWSKTDRAYYQDGAALKNTSGTTVATFSTTAVCAIVEFNGKLVVVHPVDGVFDYDGTTWTLRNATVKGTCIAAWQNKVWVGGDSSNKARVWWSNAGSSSSWTTASDFVDVRDIDDHVITAIGGGGGMDISGRPGLLVYKLSSTYRINDSSTGSYTTMHGGAGCADRGGLATSQGLTIAVDPTGVWATDGVNPPQRISRNILPLFDLSQIVPSALPNVAATVTHEGRFLFSWPIYNPATLSVDNYYSLEYDPVDKWWTMHTYGFVAAATYVNAAGVQNSLTISVGRTFLAIAQSPAAFGTTVYTDLGSNYHAKWLSPWIEPFNGRNALLQTLEVNGNSQHGVTVGVLTDLVSTENVYQLPATPLDSTHESRTAYLHGIGIANSWQLHLSDATPDVTTAGAQGVDSSWPLYGQLESPFQVARIAATFYLQGLAF